MKGTLLPVNSGKASDLFLKVRTIFTSLIFILFILFTFDAQAQWLNVGSPGFSQGIAIYQSLAFNGSTPYVAFQDSANGRKTTVMKFDGSNWVNVGAAGFSAGAAHYQSLAFDGGTPYVAYHDYGNGNKTTVMKFDGTNWVNVGSPGFSAGIASFQSLAFNGDTAYVAYRDGANGSKTTVMKFDGTNWVNVGSPGFSAGDAYWQSLIFIGGMPYVAYQDNGNLLKATVMKFDGTNWVNVGSAGFSAGIARFPSLASNGSTPYVAYEDFVSNGRTTVMKFDGTNWVNVGSPGFSTGISEYQSLAFSGSTPYVVYQDFGNGSKTTVKKFDGTNWVNVGSPGFSAGTANYISLAISGSTPYVAYRDYANGQKITVMKFINLDAGVTSIKTPAPDSTYLTCPATGFAPQLIVKNFGPDALSSFDVYLEITLTGTGIVYSEMITDNITLDSGQSRTETFPAAFNPNTVGSYTVKSWISSTSDTNSLNDTAYSAFTATQTNFGGPVFGYYFANSTAGAGCAPDQPVYYWEDTTGSTSLILNGANAAGGLLTGNVDDGFFSLGNILGGDYFRFAGVDYDSFYVSTNGIIALTRKNNTTAQLIGTTPLSLPNVNAPRPGIFPFWNDLDYGETRVPVNRLSYKNANGKLIITFDRAPSNNITLSNDYVSFQVILETSPGPTSDGLITVQFNQAGTSAGFLTKYYNKTLTSHTVGIQNNAGNAAIQYRRINLIFVTVDGSLFGSDLALSFGTNDQILPVELSSFVSSVSGNDITLNWSTGSETNNSGFDIERSEVSGQTSNAWTKIGNVSGNGTSSEGHNYSFIDKNLASGKYNYRLKQIDFNGNFEYFNLSNEVNIGVPSNYSLSQNYPNPFNPTTNLEFGISELGFVSLKVYNTSGKEVASIVNEVKPAGYYTVSFNGTNLSSGMYFYTIKAGDFVSTKRMILLK